MPEATRNRISVLIFDALFAVYGQGLNPRFVSVEMHKDPVDALKEVQFILLAEYAGGRKDVEPWLINVSDELTQLKLI